MDQSSLCLDELFQVRVQMIQPLQLLAADAMGFGMEVVQLQLSSVSSKDAVVLKNLSCVIGLSKDGCLALL